MRGTLIYSERSLQSLAYSSNSRLLAGNTDDGVLYVWDVETGQRVHRLQQAEGNPSNVAFSPDGQLLASGALIHGSHWWDTKDLGRVWIWRVDDGTLLRAFDTGFISSMVPNTLSFSHDGTLLAVGSDDEVAVIRVQP